MPAMKVLRRLQPGIGGEAVGFLAPEMPPGQCRLPEQFLWNESLAILQ